MTEFSAIITPSSIIFTGLSGKPFNITSVHPNYKTILEVIRDIQNSTILPEIQQMLREKLELLCNIASTIVSRCDGKIEVTDGVILYNGTPIHNTITERILWGLKEDHDMSSYILFLENLMQNPSKRSVDQLYTFMESHHMGITRDGYIIAYKKVKEDYHDIHTGLFDNSPGQILEMPRNMVDDDPSATCSKGFHFCSFSFLSQYGSDIGQKVVIVKVNPRDVVSVPIDHDAAKVRCCRYEVIDEYTGDDLKDILGTKPIWNDFDIEEQGDVDYGDIFGKDLTDIGDIFGENDVIRADYDIKFVAQYKENDKVSHLCITWDDDQVTEAYDEGDINEIYEMMVEQTKYGRKPYAKIINI